MTPRQRAALERLRAALDEIDEGTRRDGERPLREVVAEQARAELDRLPHP